MKTELLAPAGSMEALKAAVSAGHRLRPSAEPETVSDGQHPLKRGGTGRETVSVSASVL